MYCGLVPRMLDTVDGGNIRPTLATADVHPPPVPPISMLRTRVHSSAPARLEAIQTRRFNIEIGGEGDAYTQWIARLSFYLLPAYTNCCLIFSDL